MKTNLRTTWLGVLLLVVVGGLVWVVLRMREPVDQDKPLSVWLDQYGSNHWMHPGGDLDNQALAAIRRIGTNAIPIYLRFMTIRQSPIKMKMIALVPKQWQIRLHVPNALDYQNELHRYRVLGAFGIAALGPDAKPVVPILMGLLNAQDPDTRDNAVFALRSLGPVAVDALPGLIKCLKDPDSSIRWNAMLSLGEIHQEPERVIPILIENLGAPDQGLRRGALWSLRRFGGAAKSAVPNLLKLFDDPDAGVRSEATNLVKAIDLEAAAKAGVKWSEKD
jgi:HEAT repeat protein